MPVVGELFFVGCPIYIEKEQIPKMPTPEEILEMQQKAESNGGSFEFDPEKAELQDVWKLVIVDQAEGKKYCYRMDESLKDDLVKQLTGGIQLASEMPKMSVPTERKRFGGQG